MTAYGKNIIIMIITRLYKPVLYIAITYARLKVVWFEELFVEYYEY
jgi:hypothetical protein